MSQDCTRNSPMSASYREQYPDFGSDTKKLEALRQIRAREVWQYENSGRRREYPQEELEELDYNIQRLEAHIAEAQAAWPNVGTPAFKYEEKPPTDYERARRAHEWREWRAMMAKSGDARAALAARRTHEETNGARGWDEMMEKARGARAAAWRAHEGTHEVREWRRRMDEAEAKSRMGGPQR